ncbi:hypothetical protein IFM89_011626 [Coptis chinensis]|uniref:Trichome birefringence-like C-terminal domain-containing protein n=1 Tax=Coptis chinensis TaxID=261450 RepID=A0A835IWE8_9MAGN|nr:hypothetical protein IFM89_011626 [Coptis chinensis]
MELKKFLRSLGLSEQFISTKSRVFSGFGLGVIASVLLLTVLFLNHPLKASLLYPVVQGFSSTKSPLVSWPFQFSSRNKTAQEGIFKEVSKNSSFTAFNDGNLVSNKSQSGNFTGNEKNITVMVVEKTYQGNLSRQDYNCSIDFVSSPFLVRESSTGSTNGLTETLRLDLMDRTAPMYHDAEIVVFNTGHWWTHEKTSKGENYYQEGKHVYPRLKVMEAYTKALTTWSRWIDSNVDVSKTQVFFRGYSVTHFRGGQWNSGGQCHKEFEPIYNDTYLAKYPAKMKALESVMRRMKTPVAYLNISKLSDYRKDAHPSIYRKEYKTLEEKIEAERSQDCSHWCLPGVPDTWNELLYASLLKIGRGSWRR